MHATRRPANPFGRSRLQLTPAGVSNEFGRWINCPAHVACVAMDCPSVAAAAIYSPIDCGGGGGSVRNSFIYARRQRPLSRQCSQIIYLHTEQCNFGLSAPKTGQLRSALQPRD